jgi:hypothetical protein
MKVWRPLQHSFTVTALGPWDWITFDQSPLVAIQYHQYHHHLHCCYYQKDRKNLFLKEIILYFLFTF